MANNGRRHGLNALKARVTVRGLHAIDMRTAAAQGLIAWRNELLAALGGSENVSPQKMALVEMAVRTRMYVDHVDSWLLSQDSLVNKRRKSLLPVLRERQTLVDSLSRLLSQLGLERWEKPIKSLQQYVAEKYGATKAPRNGQGEEEDGGESVASPTDGVNVKEAEGANDAK